MKRLPLQFVVVLSFLLGSVSLVAQTNAGEYRSQEVSDGDLIPVLIKNLPEWESVQDRATITDRIDQVRREFSNPPVLAEIDLEGGAEAAYARYDAGRLLLIEYPTPQGSSSADAVIQPKLAESPGVVYRRIGNYNAFVFDATDAEAADVLLGKIHYGKTVQWLGEDPYFLQRFERYIALQGRDMVISTVLFIAGVLGTSALIGVLVGFVYFRFRQQKQAQWHRFSDAGGLTRLNLDDLSE